MDQKQFINVLSQLQGEIHDRLKQFFQRKRKTEHSGATLLIHSMRDFVQSGGKRLRPIFFYYGYRAAGGKKQSAIFDVAISIELLHHYFLIHDDIIDKDEYRRGQPTVHAKFDSFARTHHQSDPAHYGQSMGIIAGDLLGAYCYEIVAKSTFSEKIRVRALQKFNHIVSDVVTGQSFDIAFSNSAKPVSIRNILHMYEMKTARYTIEGPLHLGAIFAGAHDEYLKKLSAYAIPAGIAFQLQDDILGIFGNPDEGEPLGSDILQGKPTLLLHYARRDSTSIQRRAIEKMIGKSTMNERQLAEIQTIFTETGALAYTQKTMLQLIGKAQKALSSISLPQDSRSFLEAVSEYLLSRKK